MNDFFKLNITSLRFDHVVAYAFILQHEIKSNCERGGMKEFAECADHSQRSILGKRTYGYGKSF